MSPRDRILDRREFSKAGAASAAAIVLGARADSRETPPPAPRRIRTAVIGCGSVSNAYLPTLVKSPHVELVSVCDIRFERAERQARRFDVPHRFPDVDRLLAGAPFELLVNLTDMQAHETLNRSALEAGRHVWSEKPIANSLAAGQELLAIAKRKDVQLWGAPITVESPQFSLLSRTIQSGALGRLAAGHAFYGHEGPSWSAFFYEKGGGSLPDLAVYNLTSLTGLLGPAKHVTAMLSVVTPTRSIDGVGEVRVEAEDNAMLLLDHGDGVISHVQSGFNYFNPHGHSGKDERRHTIEIVGSRGFAGLVGYDWEPLGVDLATHEKPAFERLGTDAKGYIWQQGAALAAESLSTGRRLLVTPEHALHVLEIITAARSSQETGRRVELESSFSWPLAVE